MFKVLLLTIFVSLPVLAQNLSDERIWKISSRKKSIFLDSGVFHHNSPLKNSQIIGIRNSTSPSQGYERVVIDFNTTSIPKIYGHISNKDKKIVIDFFDANAANTQKVLKNSKFVKNIDFINVDDSSVTMDLALKGKSSFDIFYLENPGRLVIDIR